MVNKVRTLDFLPEVFKTETNSQFLRGTLDVLTSQPNLKRVQGFIGEKYGYSIEPQDRYVVEPTKARRDYQLDPSVIFLKPGTQQAQDFIDYTGIVQAIKNQGGITNRHDRLFDNQFYSWDPFVDLDKLVNYSQYYWLPLGPDAVPLSTNQIFLTQDYAVTQDDNGYKFADVTGTNPTITLLRGGTYTFFVNQDNPFWIQGVPGLTGYAPGSNIDTREILGVTNNGISNGAVTFTVPAADAQQQYTQLAGNNLVSVASSLPFSQINGQNVNDLGGIDGIIALNGKTLMFYNNGDLSTQSNFYNITVSSNIITLTLGAAINNNEKITVTSGTEYSGRTFFRNLSGTIEIVPYISAVLDTLYYQNGNDATSVGRIKIIDSNSTNSISISEIIGQKTYTSPNGIILTNGLKVTFEGNVTPSSYEGQEYYVEGVGQSINLLPVENYLAVEDTGGAIYQPWDLEAWDTNVYDIQLYVPTNPEYITITRNSRDLNAWARANRWFHQDVLNTTTQALGYVTESLNNPATRAQRPIIEFNGNLRLFNSGTDSLGFVTMIAGSNITDAFSQVAGKTSTDAPLIDGQTLRDGDTLVFPYDYDPNVRDHVYRVDYIPAGSDQVIALNPVHTVRDLQQVTVQTGDLYDGTTWWFQELGSLWTQAQQKTVLNQAPIYDVFDQSGISFANSSFYPTTTFQGCKLFSYTPGTGQDDPVLGFPIVYTNPNTLGDISFTVNLNSDSFQYGSSSGSQTTQLVSTGFVHDYIDRLEYLRRTGWVPAVGNSFQYQVFEFDITETAQTVFECDIPANQPGPWNKVQVYYNDNTLTQDQFTSVVDTTNLTTTVTLATAAVAGDKVTILLLSDYASTKAYYDIPSNLENNPFNTNITTVSVGDLRNQYRSIFNNLPDAVGPVFGDNNYHDLGSVNSYGTAIIQNSASLVLPGLFLRKNAVNIYDAIQFNSEQYTIYKQLITDIAASSDYSVYQSISQILDNILYQITKLRAGNSTFFWSDMLPSGSPYVTNTYTFGAPTTTASFLLSQQYDFDSANYNGVLVYYNYELDGRNVSTQLIRGVDYTVDGANLTVNYNIAANQSITVNEYNQTYGSYCPNTPSKLGTYSAYVPAVVLDTSYTQPTYFILGHDGSYTKLYGNYNPVNQTFDDFRDSVLLEFEKRVYNNIKVSGTIPLQFTDIIPGQFRTTDYSWSEILEMYSTNFLNWVGTNGINYKTQVYNGLNQFTYNYNQSSNKLNNQVLEQGYWRGLYRWFYDCDNPAQFPWQMLGLANEPDWWTSRYGAAPYTSNNTYMWQDIADGYVWNGGDPYVAENLKRPQLLSCLPVDGGGNLVSPIASVVGNYNRNYFQRNWKVGDGSPAESAYLKSSTWPFDLMRLMAITEPAKFFNLFSDLDRYKFNTEFDQYLYDNRYHLDPRILQIYGSGTSKNSYINWAVDFVNQRGADGYTVVSNLIQNIDVRLTYNIAGFSAKEYLRFLVETATPNSRNTNLLIPDESYQVLLYNNVPEEQISFSSVIVQKVQDGWTVFGNSRNRQYFTTVSPKLSQFRTLTAGSVSVDVSTDFYENSETIVPYGTLMYSVQAVAEFLIDYGRYLEQQGVIFDNITLGTVLNWERMAQEFILWSQQDWELGSVINLNPNAKNFTVDRPGLVVQPLTLQQTNFILNQNLLPLQSQDLAIVRENTAFSAKVLTEGDTVAYTNFELSSMEHAVVFDNYTVFNDTIYNLTTGLRQQRLLMQGYKTGDWSGYVDTSGFILNEDNVQEWQPNVKYPKGLIVTYKGFYWTAVRLIEPTDKFSNEDWLKTEYDQIKIGLLPNPSTNAYESLYYYDTNRANLEQDADLLSYSLIGFRPRQYLADADLSDTTQVNVYKNIVREKGTNLIANAFRSAELVQGRIDYDIQENWALKNGEFGAVLNSNFVEAQLSQPELKGNPTLLGFSDNGSVPDVQQTVNISDLLNWARPPQTANFLPPYTDGYSNERGLPTAGYVNTNDTKFQEYVFEDLSLDAANIRTLYRNDVIWIADHKSQWNIYAAAALNNQVIGATNLLNSTVQINFARPHGLVKNDLIAIVNFDDRIDGFYEVQAVLTEYAIVINLVLDAIVSVVSSIGSALKLQCRRFDQPSDVAARPLPYSAWTTNKIWADYDTDNEWAVYANSPVFREENVVGYDANTKSGVSVAYHSDLGTVSIDGDGKLYINNQLSTAAGGYGQTSKVVIAGNVMYVTDPTNNTVSTYSISPTGTLSAYAATVTVTSPNNIAVSDDNLWMYVANTQTGTVSVFARSASGTTYQLVYQITNPVPSSGFGIGLATSVDGNKLVVGAPYEDSSGVSDSGAAYVYNRYLQRFYANGSTSAFTLETAAPANQVFVFLNDVLQTSGYTYTGSTVTFASAPSDGTVITVQHGYLSQVSRVQSNNLHQGGLYGVSVDTNRAGGEILVGSPFELQIVNDTPNVEGAVYRYTNAGQMYGVVNCTVTGSKAGSLFIDGYLVQFNGNGATIVNQINSQTPTNIVATVTGTNPAISQSTFSITVKPGTPETVNNIIDVVAAPAVQSDLGIVVYTNTQTIYNPDLANSSEFGKVVKMNERDGLLVSAPVAASPSPTTFDFTNNCVQDDTIFDNDLTFFIDQNPDAGVVYSFDALPAHNESILNPSKYAFGQYITSSITQNLANQPRFGTSLAYADDVIVVGAPNYFAGLRGLVSDFNTTWTPADPCEIRKSSSWYLDKKPLAQVNINALNNISIFNKTDNQTLEWLDYIDPVQGKLLGAVTTNLDYMSVTDPAGYGAGDIAWGADYVGKTWLDLNTIKLLNYHQPDIVYNASNWGRAFPGSTAEIYTWIESDFEPVDYTGSGFPVEFDRFVQVNVLDGSTNSLKTKYYYWVKYFDQVPPGKTLSPIILTQYLLDPLSSGIAYLVPITTNTVGFCNSQQYIQADTSVLHLGYQTGTGIDDKHTSWTLIRENNPEDFLSGYRVGLPPTSQYLKFIESFSGVDQAGQAVPDPRLPALVRYGTSFRPRQSMFINRQQALQIYIDYANSIMIQYPIAETKNLNFLQTTGNGYNTPTYWEYVDWWAPGFGSDTKPVLELANVGDLQTITDGQLLVGNEGLTIAIEDGLVVKIAANSGGNSEYYVYNTNTGWTRIGLTNGTIQILPSLWQGPFGWSVDFWDSEGWDNYPYVEIYWIIRWLNEYCYVNELDDQRNTSLILMFKYIQSGSQEQQNYLPWLNKTSLIDVNHRIRGLLPYKKFQRDNQEFLSGYLNEIKPFHVYIKDFVFRYDGQDTYLGDVTDFDLPARYISGQGQFETPRMVYQETLEPDEYTYDAPIWQNPLYNQWYNNFGLSISNQEIGTVQASTLVNYMTSISNELFVKNSRGLPWVGYVIMGDEFITYEGIDYVNNQLLAVRRGADGTTPVEHFPGEAVRATLPSVIVLDPGRGYSEPPRVSAFIDLGVYPAPREEAEFRAVMAADRVIGIEVVNPGSGYVVKPEIYITSSISTTFSYAAVDPVDNVLILPNHAYQTGDSVQFIVSGTAPYPAGLANGSYYYVKVLDSNTVALYENYQNSVQFTEVPGHDGRVNLLTSGTNTSMTLGVCAKAVCFTSGWPVREFDITLKFDRVSYTSSVSNWQSRKNYAGLYTVTGILGSTDDEASSSGESSVGGVEMQISSATHDDDDNTTLTVSFVNAAAGQVDGQKFQFYVDSGSGWTYQTQYYVKVVSATEVKLFTDPLFNFPVPYADFDPGINVAFLDNPFFYDRSLVLYGNKLWRCVVSNNDAIFDIDKWELVRPDDPALTDSDRIIGFYRPTASMPGRTLSQILSGVEYPDATFRGARFGVENEPFSSFPWDTQGWSSVIDIDSIVDTKLTSPDFTYDPLVNPTYWNVQGGTFTQGYGPEELVPGVVTDGLNFNVNTKPGSSWPLTAFEGWDEGFYGDGRWDPDIYDHSGYNVYQFAAMVDGENQISFADQVANPVTLDIFAQTSSPTDHYSREFRVPNVPTNYTVDWYNKVITINNPYLQTVTLTIALYEFGGGNQYARSNNSVVPLREVDGHSEIHLPVAWNLITTPSASNYYGTASVYVNGVRIPYLGQYPEGGDYYTVEPEVNGINTRIVFSALYDNDTDYVTFVINGGSNGVSVPQTQTIVITNPSQLIYDLEYFMGDDNIDNVIVELNGRRIYETIPNETITTATPDISGYSIPISITNIPTFSDTNLQVEVSGNLVPNVDYVTNYSSSTLSASGLDGEWNAQYGYLDIGVPIDSTSLYVVFDPVYWPTVPLGTEVVIKYSLGTVGAPYVITADSEGRGQIEFSSSLGLAANDVITVTSFNRTGQQSLETQAVSNATVTEIVNLNTSGAVPVITTLNNHNMVDGDQVIIDSVAGTWYDNAFVRVLAPNQLELYATQDLTTPLYVSNPYPGSGAFVWKTLSFVLDQPDYRLYNTERLWVTIENLLEAAGATHINSSVLRLYNNVDVPGGTPEIEPNVLGILCEISPNDQVAYLSMVPAETPGELSFRINSTKNNVQTCWRTNGFTKTYLTETTYSTGRIDDVLHVQDARKLVNVYEYSVIPDSNNVIHVGNFPADQVSMIKIVDSTATEITDFVVNDPVVLGDEYSATNNMGVYIYVPTYTGTLSVTVAVGNRAIIQSEEIMFTSIDLDGNTITGLRRGLNNTITNSVFNQYSTVQSMLDRDLMNQEDYNVNWYDEYAPLQLNTTPQALFLQQQFP